VFGDFVDECLEITELDGDRIHKEDMLQLFHARFPDKAKVVNIRVLMSAMKDNNIEYNRELRCSGRRGVFVGVKAKDKNMLDEDEPNELDAHTEAYDKLKLMQMRLEQMMKLVHSQNQFIQELQGENTQLQKCMVRSSIKTQEKVK